jgi:hypothetical protein
MFILTLTLADTHIRSARKKEELYRTYPNQAIHLYLYRCIGQSISLL